MQQQGKVSTGIRLYVEYPFFPFVIDVIVSLVNGEQKKEASLITDPKLFHVLVTLRH